MSAQPQQQQLSLQNTVVGLHHLEKSPSVQDGISPELELDLRITGCHLIQCAGILLKLPQVAMATAQILLHRFYYQASLKQFSIRDASMGALFLATKLEECPRKLRDITNVFHFLITQMGGSEFSLPEIIHQEYKDALFQAELQILGKLGFNVHVQHAHGFMIYYLSSLGLTDRHDLVQRAWNYLNDSLRTNVYVCYQPPTIACAAIMLAARDTAVKMPMQPPWWQLFESDHEDMENIAGHILSLFKRPLLQKPPLLLDDLSFLINEM
ncbi:cyclin-like protein [Cladochytrium replicatum]|nr:cyclin-like protein [Cladochytrium replicatum]